MTSTPLIWEEKESVWKAEANGFVYEIYPPLPGTKSGLWIFTRGATLLRGYDSLGTIEGQKLTAQTFAGAIADAVSEERKLSDQLATALEEASFLTEMILGMNSPLMPPPQAHEGSPKQLMDAAIKAYNEARK